MTKPQKMSILLTRWPAACRAQGWDKNDRALRLQVISQAIGRWIKTMNSLNSTTDIDAVYAHLGRLADNVALTRETLPSKTIQVSAGRGIAQLKDTPGARRRILWLIRDHAAPLGGDPYIRQITRCNPGLVQNWSTLDDLSTPQLHQLMTTLARCRNRKFKALSDQSYQSEETFPDQVEFQPTPEPELVAGPF